ncbi:hypothetical protein [Dyadobacter psychrotolerans]|uniref:Uncharacterized protein n=1 Tax=Dyadobacter psychrotolerans TaxID=2541721 RepID=A0A4R5DSE9_9BACT|nr:hypothetical protein [Dyadobacter psychrotolerans]TDE15274.1 hypothetical protein E0F88_12180 [Dyadobacter psychrotolerans]
MKYRKETTDYGVVIYSAIQPDYDFEMQVVISPTNLICKLQMHPTPVTDNRPETTKAAFDKALIYANKFFSDYKNLNPNDQ